MKLLAEGLKNALNTALMSLQASETHSSPHKEVREEQMAEALFRLYYKKVDIIKRQ